ncbi:MAG TPA: adenylate/guanylate cyclase domain-containing protein [Kofleriaceae bacterium]|nr:adenylate/guanylate cyclase domain-containing protein [Kofleriaceae bacterium]
MSVSRSRSIGTRLMLATTLLIVAVVGVVVWRWTTSERDNLRSQKRTEARSFATSLASAYMNELDDDNWSQIRVGAELLLQDNPDFVYVIVHDDRRDDRIVAAAPADLVDQYVPDLVRLDITRAAIDRADVSGAEAETWLLRDVGTRARRGERIVEVAAPMRVASGKRTGVLRVGISLASVDRAVRSAELTAASIGALSLLVGLFGAWVLARRMTSPIRRLGASAAQIASGDLAHRAAVHRADEIGELAGKFNEMTTALEASFGQLRRTLTTFERFVPQKFLAVIAPEGIDRIEVGVGSPRRISVLFSDIRGYTKMSEGMQPLEVFNLLNEYIAAMGDEISRAGGFVDKYIGDAIMALFDDEHTDGVLDAALGMRRTLRRFNAERAAKGLVTLEAGIGMHGGDVVMGTIGFASKIESTVIGDAVNTASRIEGMTKEYGVAVLVTNAIVEGLAHPDRYHLRLISAEVKVRGRAQPVALYELLDAPAATSGGSDATPPATPPAVSGGAT